MDYDSAAFSIPTGPPFRLDLTVWALRRRAINVVDRWSSGRYSRVMVVDDNPVAVTVAQSGTKDAPRLEVALRSRRDISPQVRGEVRALLQRMLGLTIDLHPFYALTDTTDFFKALADQFYGVRPPRFPTVFEGLVNAIACQQVTLDAGLTMLNRLTERFARGYRDGDEVHYAFPRPEDVAAVHQTEIRELGFSNQRAHAIRALASSVLDGTVDEARLELVTDEEAASRLCAIRGIGRWSAEYVLLRGLGRLGVFPGDDVGAQNRLRSMFNLADKPTYERARELTSQWHGYAGLVYFHLLLERLHLQGVV